MITANAWFKIPFRVWEADKRVGITAWRQKFQVQDTGRDDQAKPLLAQVYEGAWLVRCECGGAEYAWEEGLFFCMSCGNNAHGHRLRKTVFPDDRKDIEAILARRPLKNRNWQDGETLADLMKENEEHAGDLLPAVPARQGGD